MSAGAKKLPGGRATQEDLLAIPEDERRHELIDGEIVEKGAASGEHGGAQADVVKKEVETRVASERARLETQKAALEARLRDLVRIPGIG